MRTGQPIIGRPAWYDRNPSNQVTGYAGLNVAPHSQTLRATFTVPSGKKAILSMMEIVVQRSAAATTVNVAEALLTYTPSGGSPMTLIEAPIITNGVGDKIDLCFSQTLTLNPGDAIKVYTTDYSTGGTVNYIILIYTTTFDA